MGNSARRRKVGGGAISSRTETRGNTSMQPVASEKCSELGKKSLTQLIPGTLVPATRNGISYFSPSCSISRQPCMCTVLIAPAARISVNHKAKAVRS